MVLYSVSAISAPAHADEPFPITKEENTALRFRVRAIFEDRTPLDPETVAERKESALPHPVSPPNYGRYDRPVWGYVTIVNRLPEREWVLRYTLATVEDVRLYIRPAGAQKFEQLHELGENSEWLFSGYRSATYLITLDTDAPAEIVTRLHTRAPIGFPLTISSAVNFFELDREWIASAAMLGAVPLVVIVYVTILAGVLRHRGLISLIVMLLTKIMLDSWVTGFGLLMFPFVPRASWPVLGFVMVGMFHLSSVLHIRRYLDLPRVAPRTDAFLMGSAVVIAALAIVEITGLYNVRFLLQLAAPPLFVVITASAAYAAWLRPGAGTICYALAWGLFLSEATLLMLRLLALVPFTAPTLTFSQSAVASLLFGVAIFRAIKDRDQAMNRSLAESNERFQLAMDGSSAALFEYSPPPFAFFYAPRLAELLALPNGKPLWALLAKLSKPARKQLIASLRQARAERSRWFRAEIVHETAEHGSRFLTISGAIQYGAAGEFGRICGSVIDSTSERALAVEQQLRSVLLLEKERTERSLTARTVFYAAANHDLRHPLLSLGLYLQLLEKEKTLKKLKTLLPRMLEAHRAAFRYLDHIVDLARHDTGSHKPSLSLQPVQPIFSKLIDLYEVNARQSGIGLRCVATKRRVFTDAFFLERILSNLLSNALLNTEDGGILLGCRRVHNGTRIDVIDTGPGLPEEIYRRISSAFANDSLTDGSGTLQLGLIIVQRTAAELGYTIDVKTRPGRGTRFSIVLP